MNRKKGKWKTSGLLEKEKRRAPPPPRLLIYLSRGRLFFFDGTRVDLLTTALPFIKASMSADTEPITQMVASNTPGPLFMEVLFFLLLLICYLRADNSSNSRRSGFLPASSLNGCSDEAANLIKGVDQDSLHSKSQSEGKRRGSWLM